MANALKFNTYTHDLEIIDSHTCKLRFKTYTQDLKLESNHTCALTITPYIQKIVVDGHSMYSYIKSDILLQQIMSVDMNKLEMDIELYETIENITYISAVLNVDININNEITLRQTINAVLSTLFQIFSDIQFTSTINATLSENIDIASDITFHQVMVATIKAMRKSLINDFAHYTIAQMSTVRICDLCEIEIT